MNNYTLFFLLSLGAGLNAMEPEASFWAKWHKEAVQHIKNATSINCKGDKTFMLLSKSEEKANYINNMQKLLPYSGAKSQPFLKWNPQVEMMLRPEEEIELGNSFLNEQKKMQKEHKEWQEKHPYRRSLYKICKKINSYGIADHLMTLGAGGVAAWYLIKYGKLSNPNQNN